VVAEPLEVRWVRLIDSLCQRYGCTPSRILREDANLLLYIQNVLALVEGRGGGAAGGPGAVATGPDVLSKLADMSKAT
jgi:hypothetical protein